MSPGGESLFWKREPAATARDLNASARLYALPYGLLAGYFFALSIMFGLGAVEHIHRGFASLVFCPVWAGAGALQLRQAFLKYAEYKADHPLPRAVGQD